ncbi:MAG: dihydroorotase [Verrucomicrobiia bacterium]
MNSLLLVGGRVIDPSQGLDEVADVLISEGKVVRVGAGAADKAPPDAVRIDVANKVVCPGLIDMHVHLREPGQSAKETIVTGTMAAAHGGFTSVLAMPNTSPPIDSASPALSLKRRAEEHAKVNVFITGAITKGLEGEDLAPIGSLKNAGVTAITDDGHCVQNNELMRRALEYSRMFDLPVLDHCEDRSLVGDGVAHEGRYSLVLGLRGWPKEGEEVIVARNILLAESTGARVHLQHLSSAGSVRLLREARQGGLLVSGEACPHHFTLTDAALAGSEEFWREDGRSLLSKMGQTEAPPSWPCYDPNLKMNPPVRSTADREALLEALADGTITVVASDHAPHCDFEKEVEFDHAPFGVTGLETALALTLMQLYHSGKMRLASVIRLFTVGPAQVLNLHSKGTLRPRADGDVTVFDPDAEWVFDRSCTASKSFNSPFYGWRLKGKAVLTIVAGRIVWAESDIPQAS